MKRDHRVMDAAAQLELVIDERTEGFLCQVDNDSEWRIYEYENDGTQKVKVFEVTEETPPDRSVILKDYDSGDEYVVTWNVTVRKR